MQRLTLVLVGVVHHIKMEYHQTHEQVETERAVL
jgi:hypothetical protein